MTHPTLCDCGHGPEMHDQGGICCAKLPTFPEGGFYGVCPCTPEWLEALKEEERFEDVLREAYADG